MENLQIAYILQIIVLAPNEAHYYDCCRNMGVGRICSKEVNCGFFQGGGIKIYLEEAISDENYLYPLEIKKTTFFLKIYRKMSNFKIQWGLTSPYPPLPTPTTCGITLGRRKVKRFVNVHLHCIVSNWKGQAKCRCCPPLEKFLRTHMPGPLPAGGAVVPAPPPILNRCPPFHVWPPGCYIHPILYFKNVPPLLDFGLNFWFLAPLLLNPGDRPGPCSEQFQQKCFEWQIAKLFKNIFLKNILQF